MKKITQSVCGFVMAHLTRFLLLAVLLTAGFSMRYAAQAKYALYISDHSSAVADNFCFTCNYLGAEGSGTEISINSWTGQGYSLQVDIRNFENAMIYNDADTDVYYYMTAVMYNDINDNGVLDAADTLNATYTPEFTFPSSAVTGTYQLDETTSVPCCLLPGMSTFDRIAGTQTVTITMRHTFTAEMRQFLVIQAHTIPLSKVSRVTLPQNSSYTYTTTRGVFATTLECTVSLNIGGSGATVSATMGQSSTDYTVTYKLICGDITGGISSTVDIYFDSTKMDADTNLSVTDAYGNFKKATVTMNSNSVKNCYFFKKRIGTTLIDGGQNNEENGNIYWQLQS